MGLGFIFEGKSMMGLSDRVHLKNNNNNSKILTWSSSSETIDFFFLPLFAPPPCKYRIEWDRGPLQFVSGSKLSLQTWVTRGEVWASKNLCMLYPSSKGAAAPSHQKTIRFCLRGGGDWHRLYPLKSPFSKTTPQKPQGVHKHFYYWTLICSKI